MIRLPLPQSDQLLAAVRGRLLAQLHSLDPTTAASAEMSKAHADGRYFEVAQDLFTECLKLFNPDALIKQACDALGYPDDGA